MLLTLTASCLKASLLPTPKKPKPAIALPDLPQYTREVLGLSGINLSTDLLAGASRRELDTIRERADKAGCSCLLLVESEPQAIVSDSKSEAAVARLRRVIEAAQILGCTAAAARLIADDTDPHFQTAIRNLKQVVERAERLDINFLVMPAGGLTATPEKVTELLKKVGGFRIGTLPDFETAAATKDPVMYLRRLTPYASVVCAATQKFLEPGAAPPPPPPGAAKAAAKSAAKAAPALDDEDDDGPPRLDLDALQAKLAAAAKSKGKAPKGGAKPSPLDELELELKPDAAAKSKSKKSAVPPPPPPPPPPAADDEDDDEDLTDEGLEGLIDEILAEEAGDEPPPEPLPVHPAYDLYAMVTAVASVGYDGTLSIDYRGPGDVTLGIQNSRRLLKDALDRAAASA